MKNSIMIIAILIIVIGSVAAANVQLNPQFRGFGATPSASVR